MQMLICCLLRPDQNADVDLHCLLRPDQNAASDQGLHCLPLIYQFLNISTDTFQHY